MKKLHTLKTDPEVFKAVVQGKKTYEIRFDDRGFEVGDELMLMETQHTGEEMKQGEPLVFTDRGCRVEVLHILKGPIYGLQTGWVIMSIHLASLVEKVD